MPERSLSPQRLAYLRAQKRRRQVVLALQVLLLAAALLRAQIRKSLRGERPFRH